MKDIAVIMGSSSDLRIMQQAVDVIKEFGLDVHWEVVSAHRTPQRMFEFSQSAEARGIQIIIAACIIIACCHRWYLHSLGLYFFSIWKLTSEIVRCNWNYMIIVGSILRFHKYQQYLIPH